MLKLSQLRRIWWREQKEEVSPNLLVYLTSQTSPAESTARITSSLMDWNFCRNKQRSLINGFVGSTCEMHGYTNSRKARKVVGLRQPQNKPLNGIALRSRSPGTVLQMRSSLSTRLANYLNETALTITYNRPSFLHLFDSSACSDSSCVKQPEPPPRRADKHYSPQAT
jgi:hypothetical protein